MTTKHKKLAYAQSNSTPSVNDVRQTHCTLTEVCKGPGCIEQMPFDLIPPAWAKKAQFVHPCPMYSSKTKLSLKVEEGRIQSRNITCPV